MEKSNWEHVSPVTVAGTGRGCVSNETSLVGEVKVKGWANILPTNKAARDASLNLVKNEHRSLAVVTTILGVRAGAVTVCQGQVTINKIK